MKFILLEAGWDNLKNYLKQNNLQDYIDIIGKSNILRKYSNFILRLLKNQKQVDFNKLENLLKQFERYKPKLKNKDIMQYNSIEDLSESLMSIEPSKKERKEIGAEYLGMTKNGYKVYWIKTEEASKLYGKGTKWCISGDEDNMFNSYNDDYYIYFFIKKDNKYALLIIRDRNNKNLDIWEIFSFWDALNNNVKEEWFENFLPHITPELRNKIQGDEVIKYVLFEDKDKIGEIINQDYFSRPEALKKIFQYWDEDKIVEILSFLSNEDMLYFLRSTVIGEWGIKNIEAVREEIYKRNRGDLFAEFIFKIYNRIPEDELEKLLRDGLKHKLPFDDIVFFVQLFVDSFSNPERYLRIIYDNYYEAGYNTYETGKDISFIRTFQRILEKVDVSILLNVIYKKDKPERTLKNIIDLLKMWSELDIKKDEYETIEKIVLEIAPKIDDPIKLINAFIVMPWGNKCNLHKYLIDNYFRFILFEIIPKKNEIFSEDFWSLFLLCYYGYIEEELIKAFEQFTDEEKKKILNILEEDPYLLKEKNVLEILKEILR